MVEKWYESRRIRGAVLSLIVAVAIFLVPHQFDLIVSFGSIIAGALSVRSWSAPKE